MGLADELAKLAELHRAGALNDAEYAAAKARALGDTPIPMPPCALGSADPGPRASDLERRPEWMKPWGWFLVWLGGLGFGTSTYVNWRSNYVTEALLAGLLNPVLFIGMPIGLYWLARSGVTVAGVLTAINQSTMSEEERRRRSM